jgi:hypothetical protein
MSMDEAPQHDVEPLDALVGSWTTRATHPMSPGLVVPGRSTFEWLEGRKFLIGRSRNEHPQFPDSITICGAPDGEPLTMHYYDSRGVERVYLTSLQDGVWRLWREAPGFSQRFEGMVGDGGATITGRWHLCRDGSTWDADLEIEYRREG